MVLLYARGNTGDGCGYTGPAVAKIDDTPTTDLAQDNRSKRLSGCRLRPWVDGELPFGAFRQWGLLMNEIIEQLKQEFIDHAKSNTSAEVCGVVVDTVAGICISVVRT